MDRVKLFLAHHFTKVYLTVFLSAAGFFFYGVVNLTSETSNLISLQIGIFLFWCAGNLKLSANVLFYNGFWKKFWLFILVWFNLLTVAWLLAFLTDFKIMGMIMGMS